MAQGKARSAQLGGTVGLAQLTNIPDWDFIYETSLVKHPRYNIGDRVVLPDGRVFRYGKSGSALNVDYACGFGEDEVQGYETLKNSQAVGDKQVTFTGAAHAALTEDELRGGYIIIFHSGGGGDTQFRGVVGNPASVENANVVVYLDGALDHAVIAATTAAELFYNPYAKLVSTAEVTYSKAGKPAVQVAATATYFWVQTWGPCWLSPQPTGFGAEANQRQAIFRHDGTIQASEHGDAFDTTQNAGFLIGEGYTSGPLFMLQVSP